MPSLALARNQRIWLDDNMHEVRMEAVEYAAEAAAYCGCPVILVPGNHEFYGLDMNQALADMRSLAAGTKERVHVLDRDRLDMKVAGQHVAFLGATLWTDYALMGAHWKADAMHAAAIQQPAAQFAS